MITTIKKIFSAAGQKKVKDTTNTKDTKDTKDTINTTDNNADIIKNTIKNDFNIMDKVPSFGSLFGILNKIKFIDIIKNCYIYESKEFTQKMIINHQLDSDNIMVQIWVKDESGFYYNDIVPVKIIDENNIEIDFAEKSKFKVIIKKCKYDDLLKKLKKLNFNMDLFENIRLKILNKDLNKDVNKDLNKYI